MTLTEAARSKRRFKRPYWPDWCRIEGAYVMCGAERVSLSFEDASADDYLLENLQISRELLEVAIYSLLSDKSKAKPFADKLWAKLLATT